MDPKETLQGLLGAIAHGDRAAVVEHAMTLARSANLGNRIGRLPTLSELSEACAEFAPRPVVVPGQASDGWPYQRMREAQKPPGTIPHR